MSKLIDTKVISLKKLSLALLNYVETFSFVIREEQKVVNEVMDLLENLKIYLIESKRVSEWPGTKLLWGEAILYSYYFNNESTYILYTTEDNLYKWLLPERPEDLTFYKNNNPFFISITHERDAYFEVENNDEKFLRGKSVI
jgi:hypothetical protein